jgi:hypothetical protein
MLEVFIPPIASSPREVGCAVFCSVLISLITFPMSMFILGYLFIALMNSSGFSSFSSYSWLSILIAIYAIAAYFLFAMMGLGILLLPWSMFVSSLRKVKLRITVSEISLSYSSWSKFHIFQKAYRQDIIKLELTKVWYDSSGEGLQRKPSQINIWAGTKAFTIGLESSIVSMGGMPLTSPELDWLAQELSDWLDIPISRE